MYYATLTMYLYLLAPAPTPTSDPALEADTAADAGDENTAPEDGVIAQLEQANRGGADEDPLRTIELLSTALEAYARSEGRYARDPQALELRALAQLSLARAQLAIGADHAATVTLRAAIRDQHGGTLPAERLGPTLTRFYLEQRDLLRSEGRATVSLMHSTPCEFVINGKLVDTLIVNLPLGHYRVRVRALDGSADFHGVVELVESGEVVVIEPEPLPLAAAPRPLASEPALAPRVDVTDPPKITHHMSPSIAGELARAADRKRRGTTLLGVGGGLMVIGGCVAGIGAVGMNNTDSVPDAVGSVLAALVLGPAFGITATGTLIAGGVLYGSAAARQRRARQASNQFGPITPVIAIDRKGARVGVSLHF